MPGNVCRLLQDSYLTPETSNRLRHFFASDNESDFSAHPHLTRSASGSSDDARSFNDPEERVGLEDELIGNDLPNKSAEQSVSWLHSLNSYYYGNVEFILAVNQHRFALLHKNVETSLFDVHLTCVPEILDNSTEISCAAIFGLGSLRKTERLDCMCVAIGTTTGQVAFYTEGGTLLFMEKFSTDAIRDLAFEQFADEQFVAVSTSTDVFFVQPFSLMLILSQAKAAIAKGDKTWKEVSDAVVVEVERSAPEGGLIGSVIITGSHRPTNFDQYVKLSIQDFTKKLDRPGLPNYWTMFIARTERHMGDFVWHENGQTGGVWDVTMEAVNKVVPHFGLRKFLGWKSEEPTKNAAMKRAKISAYIRGAIGEPRAAEWLIRSPCRNYLAVVDNHARVILVDFITRQIIRIWKGYRDAKCLFITTENENSTVLFLAIQAPRRELLEIWSLPYGPRVSARHHPSGAVLVDGGGEMILGKGCVSTSSSAFLLLPDGRFLAIDVPYICAFTKTSSHEHHDDLLLQKIMAETEISKLMNHLPHVRTPKSKRELILHLASIVKNHRELIEAVQFIKKDDVATHNEDLLQTLQLLAEIYEISTRKSTTVVKYDPNLKALLGLSTNCDSIFSDFFSICSTNKAQCYIEFADFITLMNVKQDVPNLKQLPDQDVRRVAHLFFWKALNAEQDPAETLDLLQKLRLPNSEVTWLLAHFWTHDASSPTEQQVFALYAFIELLSKHNVEYLSIFEKAWFECDCPERAAVMYAVSNRVRFMLGTESALRVQIVDIEAKMEELQINTTAPTVNVCYESISPEILQQNDEAPPIDLEEELEDSKEVRSPETSAEWEKVEMQLETLECWLLALKLLKSLSRIDPILSRQSPSRLAASGFGYFGEQLALLVIERHMQPDDLRALLDPDATDKPELQLLIRHLPLTLNIERIAAEIVWMSFIKWLQASEHVEYLQPFCDFLPQISTDRLRHGICELAWCQHFSAVFKECATLIDKTGRAPREREARKQLGFYPVSTANFLDAVIVCLSELQSAVRENPELRELEVEEWLKTMFAVSPANSIKLSARTSLCDAAVKKKIVNYHLVVHHLHLAMVLKLQLFSSERCHVMQQLFDSYGQRAFFLPLTSHPLLMLENVDEQILERREKWIEQICSDDNAESSELAYKLSEEWNIGRDPIANTAVRRLLLEGCDDDAYKQLYSTCDNRKGCEILSCVLAARILRCAAAVDQVFTQPTERKLRALAGDFAERAEPGPKACAESDDETEQWKSSIKSISRVVCATKIPENLRSRFQELHSISIQYLKIRIYK